MPSKKTLLFAGLLLLLAGTYSTSFSLSKSKYHQKWKNIEAAKQYDKCNTLYKQAIKEHPNEAWFYIFLGHCKKMQNKSKEALPFYEQALKLNSTNKRIIENVYYGYTAYAEYLMYTLHQHKTALRWFKKAIAIDEKNAWGYNMVGNTYRNVQQYDTSYSYYAKSYELNAKLMEHKGFLANFRAGVRDGMSQPTSTIKVKWAKLSLQAFTDDRELTMTALSVLVFADKGSGKNKNRFNIEKVISKLMKNNKEPNLQLFSSGLIKLKKGKDQQAFEDFNRVSNALNDYQVDRSIAEIYKFKMQKFDYYTMMKSKYLDKQLIFSKREVQRYFDKHPFQLKEALLPPLKGEFCSSQTEGGRSYHNGIYGHYSYDLLSCGNNSTGTAIYAVANGKVIEVQNSHADHPLGAKVDLGSKANIIRIQHENYISVYAHNKKHSARVKVGQKVKAGHKIAEIGNSGKSTAPHLHFQITNADYILLPTIFQKLKGRAKSETGPLKPMKKLLPEHRFYHD